MTCVRLIYIYNIFIQCIIPVIDLYGPNLFTVYVLGVCVCVCVCLQTIHYEVHFMSLNVITRFCLHYEVRYFGPHNGNL